MKTHTIDEADIDVIRYPSGTIWATVPTGLRIEEGDRLLVGNGRYTVTSVSNPFPTFVGIYLRDESAGWSDPEPLDPAKW